MQVLGSGQLGVHVGLKPGDPGTRQLLVLALCTLKRESDKTDNFQKSKEIFFFFSFFLFPKSLLRVTPDLPEVQKNMIRKNKKCSCTQHHQLFEIYNYLSLKYRSL